MANIRRMGNKGGKKLRRCREHKFKATPKVRKGPLHKHNGPETRVPTWKPNPILVAYYQQRVAAGKLSPLADYKRRLANKS